MKKKIKKPTGRFDYIEYLESLHSTIERLEKAKYLYEYFLPLKRNRNSFLVEMRRIIALNLEKEGYNVSDIGRILSRDHASIIHIKKTTPSYEIGTTVVEHYQQWIQDKVYPKAVLESEPSYFHPAGVKRITTYKLVPL